MINIMKPIPTEARCDALEIRVNNLEIKIQEMKEKIHYFSYEMAKYFRKYNKLEQKLELDAINNVVSNIKILIQNNINESISISDYGLSIKEQINNWFNIELQKLASEERSISARIDQMEQTFLNFMYAFEHGGVKINVNDQNILIKKPE